MISLFLFAALIALASAAPTSAPTGCENWAEKVASVDWDSSLVRNNDPCFGYTYSCCESLSDYCQWGNSTVSTAADYTRCYLNRYCTNNDGANCPACCWSYDLENITPTSEPSDEPTAPTAQPTEPTSSPTSPTSSPTSPTASPTGATDSPTPSPVTAAPVTAAPTVHSAKKWVMLHPNYEGGDGELLWNVYYGDYAEDPRFDDFRQQQMWDVEVIRPVIEEDVKYARFQLAHQVNTHHGGKSVSHHQWLIVAAAAIVILAAFGMWMKQRAGYSKLTDSVETQPLIKTYGQ